MTKLEDKIKYYESRIEFFAECLSGRLRAGKREVYECKMGCYKTMLSDLQSLTESHRAEIEEAYTAGAWDGFAQEDDRLEEYEDGADYYEKTYGPEKFKKEL